LVINWSTAHLHGGEREQSRWLSKVQQKARWRPGILRRRPKEASEFKTRKGNAQTSLVPLANRPTAHDGACAHL